MPNLPLTAAKVHAEGSRLVLAEIECVMLWPDDAEKRAQAFEAARVRDFLELVAAAESLGIETPIGQKRLEWLASAPRIEDVHAAVKQPFLHGMIAGLLVLGMLENPATKLVAEMKKAEAFAIKEFGQGLSYATISNTIWRRYRPVAHLWAATLARKAKFFPCGVAELPLFLALSERIRGQAQQRKLSRNIGTLLDQFNVYRVPPEIELPRDSVAVINSSKAA